MKTPVYIGESSRSAYERGLEHLNNLARLSSSSHMLRHMVQEHHMVDMVDVRWGMFILDFKRSAFERQISEAVTIQQVASEKPVLNSRSEWNQSALPCLVTRLGNKEDELKQIEKELKEEKRIDDEIEEKIRTLRKAKNKTRLVTEKNTSNKRQKLDNTEYVSLRDTWGPPPTSAPVKNKNRLEEEENIRNNKKMRTEITLTNIRRIEDRVIEGETITEFEIEEVDWEMRLQEHRDRLEKERLERKQRFEKQEMKIRSWALHKECKQFLEENEKNWKLKREERLLEEKKQERMAIIKSKQENIRLKVQERKLKEEITKKVENLPYREQERIEKEEEKQRRKELIATKKSLWQLRSKERQYKQERKSETVQQLEKIDDMKRKLEMITTITENLRREKEKEKKEIDRKKEAADKEWKKKVKEKYKKEEERKNKIKKDKQLAESWEMLHWVNNHIKENSDIWEKERLDREEDNNREIEEWNKSRRLEKIKILKRKWTNDTTERETEKKPIDLHSTEITPTSTANPRGGEITPSLPTEQNLRSLSSTETITNSTADTLEEEITPSLPKNNIGTEITSTSTADTVGENKITSQNPSLIIEITDVQNDNNKITKTPKVQEQQTKPTIVKLRPPTSSDKPSKTTSKTTRQKNLLDKIQKNKNNKKQKQEETQKNKINSIFKPVQKLKTTRELEDDPTNEKAELAKPVLKTRIGPKRVEIQSTISKTFTLTKTADLQKTLPSNKTFPCSEQLSDANLDQMIRSDINNERNQHGSLNKLLEKGCSTSEYVCNIKK